MLRKLETAGVSGNLLEWFKNYLSDRKQRIILPGISSYLSKILAGVPQGSILGHLLFLIFKYNIVHEIVSCIRLFADDSSLCIIVDDPVSSADRLNADLVKLLQWAETCRPVESNYRLGGGGGTITDWRGTHNFF